MKIITDLRQETEDQKHYKLVDLEVLINAWKLYCL